MDHVRVSVSFHVYWCTLKICFWLIFLDARIDKEEDWRGLRQMQGLGTNALQALVLLRISFGKTQSDSRITISFKNWVTTHINHLILNSIVSTFHGSFEFTDQQWSEANYKASVWFKVFFGIIYELKCLNRCYVSGRHNQYDGEEECWVTVRESGKRTETTSYEEMQQKEQEVRIWYVSNLCTNKNSRWFLSCFCRQKKILLLILAETSLRWSRVIRKGLPMPRSKTKALTLPPASSRRLGVCSGCNWSTYSVKAIVISILI